MNRPVSVGFFGKLPARGDFVRAGLSRDFVACWDVWLQRVLPVCREAIGADWDRTWHAAPAWRFSLAGRWPAIGVFLPSVDRAGRHFPLTIAAEGAAHDPAFLDAAEEAGRDAVEREIDPDALLRRLRDIAPPLAPRIDATPPGRWWHDHGAALSLDALPDAPTLARMLSQ